MTLTGATTTTATFSIPELTGATALTFQLTVTAGGASVTDTVVVTVNADNDAPTAEAGSEQFIHEGTVVTLTGSGEDPENTALSYAWTQTGGSPTVTLTGGTTTTATFTAPELVEDVTLTFTLTVTDAGGASGTDTVAIRVWANNDAPTAAAGSDQTVSEGDAVTLTGTGQDPEQSVLTYAWRQTGGAPTMTLTGAATATTTFTVPELTGAHDPDVHADGDGRRRKPRDGAGEWHRRGGGDHQRGQRPTDRGRGDGSDGERRRRRDPERQRPGSGERGPELRLDADRGHAHRDADGGDDDHGDVQHPGVDGAHRPDVPTDGDGRRSQCDRHGGGHGQRGQRRADGGGGGRSSSSTKARS